jgi:hypothetical protein
MPVAWRKKLHRFFRGLQRKAAQERQDGKRPLTVGKAAMPHRLYIWLCEYFLHKGNIFAWAYLTLAWNSMARSGSVADVKLAHLEPAQDALGLHVPKSKADQAGDRAAIAWQIFASDDVRQCCVTALSLLLVSDEMRTTDDRLFMGGSQERRFAHDLEQALKTPEGNAMLVEVGRAPGSITTHSTRKGSAAFASNGTCLLFLIFAIFGDRGGFGNLFHWAKFNRSHRRVSLQHIERDCPGVRFSLKLSSERVG